MGHLCRFLFIFLLFVSACAGGGSPSRRLLERADSLLDVRPDSALRLLQGVSPRQLADRGGRMHYALLLMQAKYKNYLPVSEDDTLARELAVYYEERGDRSMLARAYYLLGGVYAERQEADHAFRAYHEAARLARQAEDGRTLCLTLNQWAHLCLNHGMAARGDSLYAETARLARQVGDSVRWAEALLRRGAYALSLGDSAYPRAEQLIEEGYGLARRLRSARLFQLAYLTQSVLYSNTGRMTQALTETKEYLENVQEDSANLARACLLMGGTYFQINRYDSAEVYLHRALKADDYLVKESACTMLARMAEYEKDYERLALWERKRSEYLGKRQALEQETRMAVAAREVELMQALRTRDSKISFLLVGMTILALLLSGSGVTWIVWRQRKRKSGCLQGASVKPEIGFLEWDYRAFRQKMQETNSYRLLGSILYYYKKTSNYERRWELGDRDAFFREVDGLLPNHRMTFERLYPELTQDEVFCCYLYMLGFSDEQVGILLERTRSTVYRRRKAMMINKMELESTDIDCLVRACHIPREA